MVAVRAKRSAKGGLVRGLPVRKEAEVLREGQQYLRLLGYDPIRVNVQGVPLPGGGYRPAPYKGVSDILLCVESVFVAAEAKSETGRLSEDQERFRDSVEKRGGVYGVFRSTKDLDRILERAREIARRRVA